MAWFGMVWHGMAWHTQHSTTGIAAQLSINVTSHLIRFVHINQKCIEQVGVVYNINITIQVDEFSSLFLSVRLFLLFLLNLLLLLFFLLSILFLLLLFGVCLLASLLACLPIGSDWLYVPGVNILCNQSQTENDFILLGLGKSAHYSFIVFRSTNTKISRQLCKVSRCLLLYRQL